MAELGAGLRPETTVPALKLSAISPPKACGLLVPPSLSPASPTHCLWWHSHQGSERSHTPWRGCARALGSKHTLHLSGHKFAFWIQEAPIPSMSNVINYSKPSATVFKRTIKGSVRMKHSPGPPRRAGSWGIGDGKCHTRSSESGGQLPMTAGFRQPPTVRSAAGHGQSI